MSPRSPIFARATRLGSAAERDRLARAPRAFTTRRVPLALQRALIEGAPRAGDLVLARVDALGNHRRLHLPDGRRQNLFVGDHVVVAYASRYAPRQFEAVVPNDLGPCHLVAAGGVAAEALSWHDRVRRGPTRITPIGLIAAEPGGPALNTGAFTLGPPAPPLREPSPPVICLLGTSMNAGKTTAAAYLTRGLGRAGLRVGFAKVTGTGASGDPFLLRDAGADPVLDFTDVGYVSTYHVAPRDVQQITTTLTRHLRAEAVDVILLEVGDGLLQPETAELLDSHCFRELVDGVVFAATDAMGAAFGVERIRRAGHELLAVSGTLTASPLLVREALYATGSPVIHTDLLLEPAEALKVVGPLGLGRPRA